MDKAFLSPSPMKKKEEVKMFHKEREHRVEGNNNNDKMIKIMMTFSKI